MSNNHFHANPQSTDSIQPELDRLVLLSAYIDGEATPEECRQAQHLLDTDPAFKRQYLHLHQIRQGLQVMPVPVGQSPAHLSNQVFRRLRWRRSKVISLWGTGAIAALFIAGVMGMPRQANFQMVENNVKTSMPSILEPPANEEEALVVALNRPVLQIPKLATTSDLNE